MKKSPHLFCLTLLFALFFTLFFTDSQVRASVNYARSAFLDEQNRREILIIQTNTVERIDAENLSLIRSYPNLCSIKPTVFNPVAWAYPVLSSIQRTCIIDESKGTFENFSNNPAPQNAFAITYFGQDESHSYFLFNAKPWAEDGSLYLKSVERSTGEIQIKTIVNHIPHYSGAMSLNLDQNKLLYIEATDQFPQPLFNQLHSIDVSTLWSAIKGDTTLDFNDLSNVELEFSGLSLWLSPGESGLLIGKDEGAYWVNSQSETQPIFTIQNCEPFAFYSKNILFHCGSSQVIKKAL